MTGIHPLLELLQLGSGFVCLEPEGGQQAQADENLKEFIKRADRSIDIASLEQGQRAEANSIVFGQMAKTLEFEDMIYLISVATRYSSDGTFHLSVDQAMLFGDDFVALISFGAINNMIALFRVPNTSVEDFESLVQVQNLQ